MTTTWTEPRYSRSRVDKAGACYVDPRSKAADRDAARVVINNWRSSHSYPLNTIQVNLRRAANGVDSVRVDRDAAIRAAYKSGLPMKAIAQVLGMSHQRVSQIVRS